MNILVTGGAGYIGSHTVYLLQKQGYNPIVIDNLSSGHREALSVDLPFYQGDISDGTLVKSIIKKHQIEGVIHFAASSLVGESMENPMKYYENNVVNTTRLLAAVIESGVENFIFSSTAAVYGEPENIPIKETDTTKPTNVYGHTKLILEEIMSKYTLVYPFNYVALRYFNACGAVLDGSIGEDHNPETHLIPIIMQVANRARESINIFGTDYPTEDGTCIRDYIHVLDLAQAHILALDYLVNGGTSETFNLGSSAGFSVREIINTVMKVIGKTIPVVEGPRRQGDPAVLVASSEKAKIVLGWVPEYSMEDMIESAWRWHKGHTTGYTGVRKVLNEKAIE